MIVLLAIGLAASSETLIIVSNFFLGLATLLVFWASMREQHQTFRELVKSDNGIIKRLTTLLGKRNK